MRFGLIGCGKFGINYAKTLKNIEGSSLAAICTRSSNDKVKEQIGDEGISYYTDYFDLLKDQSIEVVIVATPPTHHFGICLDSLYMGKHIICEKPTTLSSREAGVLRAFSEYKKRNFITNYIHLWNPRLKEVMFLLDVFGGEGVKHVYSEGVSNGPVRSEYNVAWDWLPHDFALIFSYFGLPNSISRIGYSNPNNVFNTNIYLELDYGDFKADICCGNANLSRSRKFIVSYEKEIGFFEDDRKSNPLELMLREFIKKTESGESFSNLDLTVNINSFIEKVSPIRKNY